MTLQEKIKSLPDAPGIYKYFDENGKLLYVGKAKSLKKRVKSYFEFNPSFAPSKRLSHRIDIMISLTHFLEYIVVDSEHDALILENSLIKQLKPKFNILLRDDKSYPYIYVDYSEDFPRLEITRKVINKKGIKYYGPYSSGARDLLNSIYDIFSLVQKKNCIKYKKACLFYQIDKCHAPCEDKITKEDYALLLKDAISMINDRKKIVSILENKMKDLAFKERFEEAGKIRDMAFKIKSINSLSAIDIVNEDDIDIFAVYVQKNRACVAKMFLRSGRISSSTFSIVRSSDDIDKDELYKRVLMEYYAKDVLVLPRYILVSDTFIQRLEIEKFLQEKFSKKIPVLVPIKGIKKRVVNIALLNAKENLKSNVKRNSANEALLLEIKDLFLLSQIPYEIEVFDNSHISGSAIVGGCVCWREDWVKDRYRHYNLKGLDEYSQMRELLTKRIESFDKNPAPNLWVIDGGSTLLKLALELVQSSGVDIDVIAISKEKRDAKSARVSNRSKGGANDEVHTKDESFKLSPRDKRLQFIQLLRDEAHRFAISYHKKQKQKQDMQMALLEKEGIGKAKLKKLLNYFGTFEKIKNASKDEIQEVIGK